MTDFIDNPRAVNATVSQTLQSSSSNATTVIIGVVAAVGGCLLILLLLLLVCCRRRRNKEAPDSGPIYATPVYDQPGGATRQNQFYGQRDIGPSSEPPPPLPPSRSPRAARSAPSQPPALAPGLAPQNFADMTSNGVVFENPFYVPSPGSDPGSVGGYLRAPMQETAMSLDSPASAAAAALAPARDTSLTLNNPSYGVSSKLPVLSHSGSEVPLMGLSSLPPPLPWPPAPAQPEPAAVPLPWPPAPPGAPGALAPMPWPPVAPVAPVDPANPAGNGDADPRTFEPSYGLPSAPVTVPRTGSEPLDGHSWA